MGCFQLPPTQLTQVKRGSLGAGISPQRHSLSTHASTREHRLQSQEITPT